MPNALDQLQCALAALSTERLQRLVDRLEGDPNVKVTVGSWRPHCPMVLAGFDPVMGSPSCPEQHFASVWDRFATREPRRRWLMLLWPAGGAARRSDVQVLVRSANAMLAARMATRTQIPAREECRSKACETGPRPPRSRR
jgi:hypothetical protein